MALDYGPGVSRTLDPTLRQFEGLVFQAGKPPLDSEMNLMSQAAFEALRQRNTTVTPSGFFLDTDRTLNDYRFNPSWTNQFILANPRTPYETGENPEVSPVLWAIVNGWTIPVAGTNSTDPTNVIKLFPPPASDARIDFIYLEAWAVRIDANPSTANKPSASTIWPLGNTLWGGSGYTDDMEDPALGYRTTGRIQIQYAVRVYGNGVGLGASVALDVYPEGLGDPNVLGQGSAASPVGGYQFANCRETLGDPGLFRAGDGNPNNTLGTVDGYTYAIPVCAIFRRNSQAYVAINTGGNANHNGAFCRTPSLAALANPQGGAGVLAIPTLTAHLLSTSGGSAPATITITNLPNSSLADPSLVLSSTFLVIDDEIIGISNVNVSGNQITIPAGGRGRYGTDPSGHNAGASIQIFNTRPDGLFADQIAPTDLLDLRHGISPGGWDFKRLLEHNVGALLKNTLHSTWKQSAVDDTQGAVAHEISYLAANGISSVPNQTEGIDGPDGIRTVWSDAATPQPDVTVLLDNTAPEVNNTVGLTNPTFDAGSGFRWDVTAGFWPSGFMNIFGESNQSNPATHTNEPPFCNGTSILLFLGGNSGNDGARATFREPDTYAVRALMPKEWWKTTSDTDVISGNQYPLSLRFLNQKAHEPAPDVAGVSAGSLTAKSARHVGPMFPWWQTNFERPFIVLGGMVNSTLRITGVAATSLVNVTNADGTHHYEINFGSGPNFDAAGTFYSKSDGTDFDPLPVDQLGNPLVTQPLMRGNRTLWSMLTKNGQDTTGSSSEVYVVLYGDQGSIHNNGAFKVVGAGTAASGYTSQLATTAYSIVVQPLCPEFAGFDTATGNSLTVEFRSQESNADDTSSYATKIADVVIVMTDIGGVPSSGYSYPTGLPAIGADHPWTRTALGHGAGDGYDLSMPFSGTGRAAVASKMLISMTLQYHPGRSGMARVPDDFVRFALVGAGGNPTTGAYLRQSPGVLDSAFTATGTPPNEIDWDDNGLQLWNRISSAGWYAQHPLSDAITPVALSYGGNTIGNSEADRDHELFVDLGSKTVVFRPFRDRRMTLDTHSFTSMSMTGCLLGPTNYPNGSMAPKDGLSMWTSGKQMATPIPREYMPRFGRQDIPVYTDITDGAGPFLSGINHLFRDSPMSSETVFNFIGGDPNGAGVPGINSLFFITGNPGNPPETPSDYGNYRTTSGLTNNVPFIWARRTGDINPSVPFAPNVIKALAAVRSSDLGPGLAGIQLPPYYGPARIYGVYDVRDFNTAGGQTFDADRITPMPAAPPNLLRQDATQQTLYILKDGAQDLTTPTGSTSPQLGDHTYILPYNALDITRASNYTSGDLPQNYHYVIECVVFGFARGFINENNLALVRLRDGTGFSLGSPGVGPNVDTTPFEAAGVHMVLPCAAGYDDQLYAAYNRTVYQGDPFMSRNGTKTDTDYVNRYGQLSVGAQYAMRQPIQQFENGVQVPQTPNARPFEVLAALDFYTTMGTGKIGGSLIPGTLLDIGYTQNTLNAANRMPVSSGAPGWRVLSRTFTEGQKSNTSHASLTLALQNNSSNNPNDPNPVDGLPWVSSYTLVGTWGSGPAYSVNSVVLYSGAYYVATLTTTPGNNPSVNSPNQWSALGVYTMLNVAGRNIWLSKSQNVSLLTGSPANIPSANIAVVDTSINVYELPPVTVTPTPYSMTFTVSGTVNNGDHVVINSDTMIAQAAPATTGSNTFLDTAAAAAAGTTVAASLAACINASPIGTGLTVVASVSSNVVTVTALLLSAPSITFSTTGTGFTTSAWAPASSIGLPPSIAATQSVTVPGVAVGDAVNITSNTPFPAISVTASVSSPNTVTLKYLNTATPAAFTETTPLSPGVITTNLAVSPSWSGPTMTVNANSSLAFTNIPFPGAALTDALVATMPNTTLVAICQVQSTGMVEVTIANPYSAPVTLNSGNWGVVLGYLNASNTLTNALTTSNTITLTVIKQRYSPNVDLARTITNLTQAVNNPVAGVYSPVWASPPGQHSTRLTLIAKEAGAAGNALQVTAQTVAAAPALWPVLLPRDPPALHVVWIDTPTTNLNPASGNSSVTGGYLTGGVDLFLNAGNGTSQISLGGMTERLPLGALLQDSDFLSENPLRDNTSAVRTSPSGPRPVQSLLPLTNGGSEFNRFFGEPGSMIAMSDGTICVTDFTAYQTSTGLGTKRYRIFRGGGPLFVFDEPNPGGPLDWASDSLPASAVPVLKGGLLACRALLVRNFREEVLPTPYKVSDGDEIQMVIVTQGILGEQGVQQTGLNLGGIISPTGYGEGWASADRYRLDGKPLLRGYSRQVPNPNNTALAPYTDALRTDG